MPAKELHVFLLSYNRPANLARTLEALRAQTLRDWRITLVQDGPRNEGDSAERATIGQCVDVFRRIFPAGEILLHPTNTGVGLNVLRAQERAFTERGLEAAFFFEDDLVPHPSYLEQMGFLHDAIYPYRQFVPYFACYGRIHAFSPRREHIPGAGLRFMDHLWAYGLFREHWEEEQRLLRPYFDYLRSTPYHERNHDVIEGIFHTLGHPHSSTSQDGARIVALCLLGRCAVTTAPARATYIGIEGEHSGARSYSDWGFEEMAPGDDPALVVPQLSAEMLQAACAEFPAWVAKMEDFPPNRLARLRATVSRQQLAITELASEVSSLRRRIAGLENSRSWRITAPLRRITGLCRGAWRRTNTADETIQESIDTTNAPPTDNAEPRVPVSGGHSKADHGR